MKIEEHLQGLDAIKDGWNWWSGELAQLVPEKIRDLFSIGSTALLISIEEGSSRLELKIGQEVRLLGVVDLENATDQDLEELRDSILAGLPPTTRVEVTLPLSNILVTEIFLPLAVANNLQTVLQYEIDRLTPFNKDEVFFSYRIQQRFTEYEKIKIELFAVHSDKLTLLLRKLEVLGLNPGVVSPGVDDPDNNTASMNLLPPEKQATTETLWNSNTRKLTLASTFLLLFALAFPAWRLESTANALQADISEIRAEATRVAEKRSSMATRLLAQDAIILRKNRSPEKLQLLYDITQLLPDNTWVSRLKVDDRGVSLQGESSKASDLIELLEQFDKFENVGFQSSITHNAKTSREKYEIHMNLVGGET